MILIFLNCLVLAAFKVIKGWLPPAAVKKIKFLTKTNMNEYVTDDNRLEEWGGTDTWQYSWIPENSGKEGRNQPQSILASNYCRGLELSTIYIL